jgi:hypothetical protein
MADQIPLPTIQTFARSIYKEAAKYGFGQLDVIRLVNELMDCCTAAEDEAGAATESTGQLASLEGDFTSRDRITNSLRTGCPTNTVGTSSCRRRRPILFRWKRLHPGMTFISA